MYNKIGLNSKFFPGANFNFQNNRTQNRPFFFWKFHEMLMTPSTTRVQNFRVVSWWSQKLPKEKWRKSSGKDNDSTYTAIRGTCTNFVSSRVPTNFKYTTSSFVAVDQLPALEKKSDEHYFCILYSVKAFELQFPWFLSFQISRLSLPPDSKISEFPNSGFPQNL